MHHQLEVAGADSALRLLVDDGPWRQAAGKIISARANSHNPGQGVEDLEHFVEVLRGVGRHQRQVWVDKGPLVIRNVTRVGLAGMGAYSRSLRS